MCSQMGFLIKDTMITVTYFKAKFVEDDANEKWLSWSHWGSSVEEGFYYVSNEARAAIFFIGRLDKRKEGERIPI